MKPAWRSWLGLAGILVCAAPAVGRAQEPAGEPRAPEPAGEPVPLPLMPPSRPPPAGPGRFLDVDGAPLADEAPAAPSPWEIEERMQRLEEIVNNRGPTVTWSGYVDFGFFAVQGNGAGYVQDFGHQRYPEHRGHYGWVFLGDILSTAVNARGEAADLGDAPGVDRFDSVNSRGAPGFIANEVNFTVRSALTPTALLTASFNLVPRTGNDFRLGDVFDLDLAQLEWLPTESQRTSIFVGKMDSVVGIEYRDRKANRRFGITPSLLARYTVGPALGAKVRSKFGSEDWLVVAAAVTNGSNGTEQFHFYDEVDSNAGKSASGRLSLKIPLPFTVELGMSGAYGAQDRGLSSHDAFWLFGPDLTVEAGGLALRGQWLKARAPGNDAEQVYGLDLKGGGYVELDWMFGATFGALGRLEYRDAFVWLGSERAYLTKSWRATVGARVVLLEKAVLKAEYLRNGEFGGLPKLRNDVFTSSLVLSY